MNQDKQSELLPCPFCGGEPHTLPGLKRVFCWEVTCNAEQAGDTLEEAIRLWNTRPSPSTPSEGVIERLREALEPFAKAADAYSGNQDEFEVTLPRGPFFGKDDWPPRFKVSDFRRAREALARLSPLPLVEEGARPAKDTGA